MSLQRVIHIDESGRKKYVLLPEGVSENEADKGIPVGPPDFTELGLPEELEVRLNNELFNRGIIEVKDALRGRDQIQAALMSVLKVDAGRVVEAYTGKDYNNARPESPENFSNSALHDRRPRKPR